MISENTLTTATRPILPTVPKTPAANARRNHASQLTSDEILTHELLLTQFTLEDEAYREIRTLASLLKQKILATVQSDLRFRLDSKKSVREWLQIIENVAKPTMSYTQTMVQDRYMKLVNAQFLDWPVNGPEKWIIESTGILADINKHCDDTVKLEWHTDIRNVWGDVPDLDFLNRELRKDQQKDIPTMKPEEVSSEILEAWLDRKSRNTILVVNHTKSTRAAFTAEAKFDGEPSQATENPDVPVASNTAHKQTPASTIRKRAGTDTNSRQRGRNKKIQGSDRKQDLQNPNASTAPEHIKRTAVGSQWTKAKADKSGRNTARFSSPGIETTGFSEKCPRIPKA